MRKSTLLSFVASLILFAATAVQPLHAQLQPGPSTLVTFSSANNYGDEYFHDVFRDRDGAAYVIGKSDGPLENDFSNTRYKLVIQKYSAAGTKLWEVFLKDAGKNFDPQQIAELDSESLLARYDDNNLVYIAKLSKATGERLWTKPLTGTLVAEGTGRFYLIRSFNYSDSLTTVECYDTNGLLLWQRQVQFEALRSFASWPTYSHLYHNDLWYNYAVSDVTSDGDLLIGGITESSSAFNLPSFVRIDASGSEVHSVVKLPNTSAGTVFSVTSDPEGNAYVLNFIADSKLALTKISRSGTQLWQKQLPNFSASSYVRSLFIGDYLALIRHNYDGSAFTVGIYDKNGNSLQSWNFQHQVGSTYGYSISPEGYLASVGAASYPASAVDATLRLSRIQEVPVRQISLSGDLAFGAVNIGTSAQRTMTIANTGNSALSVTSISLPSGFSAGWTSGTIAPNATQQVTVSFSPVAGQNYGGLITVDSNATGGTASIACSGSGLASAPVITSAGSASGQADSFFSYQITASTPPTSFGASGLPTGLSVNSTTGLISGTPTQVGTFNVSLSASNSGGAGSSTLNLTISSAPPPPPVTPVITSSLAALEAEKGVALSYQITANNSPTSFGASGLPAGLSVNSSTGLISGTPMEAGAYAVTITASNAAGTDTEVFYINIDEPVITALSLPKKLNVRAGRDAKLALLIRNNSTEAQLVEVVLSSSNRNVIETDSIELRVPGKKKASSAARTTRFSLIWRPNYYAKGQTTRLTASIGGLSSKGCDVRVK
jgi:PKD repeat protein